jgi:hypothetical protein
LMSICMGLASQQIGVSLLKTTPNRMSCINLLTPRGETMSSGDFEYFLKLRLEARSEWMSEMQLQSYVFYSCHCLYWSREFSTSMYVCMWLWFPDRLRRHPEEKVYHGLKK